MAEGRGYEAGDVRVRRLLGIGAGLLAGLVVTVALTYALYTSMVPGGRGGETAVPPEPQLQPHPGRDLAAFRRAKRAKLEGYGWVDREAGLIHIPIGRAMRLYAQRHGADAAGDAAEAGP